MQKILIKLLNLMGITAAGQFILEGIDGNLWRIQLPLGVIPAGTYTNTLWGDVKLAETQAWLSFTVGNSYDDTTFTLGEGTVTLDYADGNTGLAYGGELETVIVAMIKAQYNIDASGSEQGMQGDDYLSLDLWSDSIGDLPIPQAQLDADDDDSISESFLKPFYRGHKYPGVTNGDLYRTVLA